MSSGRSKFGKEINCKGNSKIRKDKRSIYFLFWITKYFWKQDLFTAVPHTVYQFNHDKQL